MNILFVNFRTYDNVVAHKELAWRLVERGHRVTCFTAHDEPYLTDRGVEVVVQAPLGARYIARWRFFREAADYAFRGGYDRVVVCQMHLCFVTAWRVKTLRTRHREWTCRIYDDIRSGSVSGVFDRFQNRLIAWQGLAFDHRMAAAEPLRASLFGARGPHSSVLGIAGPSDIIHAGREERRALRERLGLQADRYLLLYIGTFAHRRLHEFLEQLVPDDDRLEIVMVGQGRETDMHRINRALARPGIGERVTLTGQVHYSELDDYLRVADAGLCYVPVIPRFTDQPPVKLFQYLAYRLPVVVTRTRYIESQRNTYGHLFVDAESCTSAKALVEACAARRAAMGSRKVAVPTWESLADDLAQLLGR